jgi:transposase
MSDYVITTDGGRRRRCHAAEKTRIVEEILKEDASITVFARRNGVAPNLHFSWQHMMLNGEP